MQQPVPFGKYILLERISVGGMAEVFKAKTFGVKGFARMVAIKRILPQLAEDANFVDMFISEAKTAVELNHPNLCQVFDLGLEGNEHYIAMEYIQGKDLLALHNLCRRTRQRLPVPLAAYIGARMADGLDYAHRRRGPDGQSLGIVHRDVSPQNVLVTYDGGVKVIDFGIAKARARDHKETAAGILKGKFGYMSPEQIDGGRHIDHRSDIFAIGTVIYELLTGRRLFLGDSDFATLEKIRNATYEPARALNPDVPPELDALLARALARDPDARYPWASEFAEDLQAWLQRTGRGPLGPKLGDWMRTHFAVDLKKELDRNEQHAQVALAEDDAPEASSDASEEDTELWEPLADDSREFLPSAAEARVAARPTVAPHSGALAPVPAAAPAAPLSAPPSLGLVMPPLSDRGAPRSRRREATLAGVLVLVAAVSALVAYRVIDAPPPPPTQGTLVVRVTPADELTIYLNNQVVGTATPLIRPGVQAGAHALRIERDGSVPHQSSVEVRAGGVADYTVELEATSPPVMVVSDPPGDVYVNGQLRGRSPMAVPDLDSGREYTVRIVRPGFRTHEERLGSGPSRTPRLDVKLLPLSPLPTIPQGKRP